MRQLRKAAGARTAIRFLGVKLCHFVDTIGGCRFGTPRVHELLLDVLIGAGKPGMLNRSPLYPLIAVAVLVSAGCGSSIPTGPTAAGPGVTTSAVAPRAWRGAVVLGRAGQTSGKTQSQTGFLSHDLIELRVDVGGIPPKVEVRATWLDATATSWAARCTGLE